MVCIIATTPDRTHAPTHTHVYANATSSSSFCSLYSLVPFSGKRREVSEALRDPPPLSPADTQPPFLMNNEEEVKAPSYLRHEAVIACIAREEEKGAGLLRNGEDDVNRGRLITEIPPLPHFGKGNHIGGKCSFSLLPICRITHVSAPPSSSSAAGDDDRGGVGVGIGGRSPHQVGRGGELEGAVQGRWA